METVGQDCVEINTCVECKQRDKANKDARHAAAVEKARASIMPGALAAARKQLEAEARQLQREAERETKRATKAAEKEAKRRERIKAKARATREANKAAKQALPATDQVDTLAPWD